MSISLNIASTVPIENYDDLQNEILNWMDREEDAAAIARVPKWILFAESWFNRELRTPEMEQSYTFTADAEDMPLPSDYLAMRAIYQETEPDLPLNGMSPDQLRRDFGGYSGTPQAYAIVGGGIRFAPVPERELLYTMDYFGRIENLSVTAPSNWVLQTAPELYLFAALFFGYTWAKNKEDAAESLNLATGILDRLKITSTAARWGGGQKPNTARQASRGRC
jgi:hypothetical protein